MAAYTNTLKEANQLPAGRPLAVASYDYMRKFILSLGIDPKPPRALWFGDAEGRLMLRATPEELETFEKALAKLTGANP